MKNSYLKNSFLQKSVVAMKFFSYFILLKKFFSFCWFTKSFFVSSSFLSSVTQLLAVCTCLVFLEILSDMIFKGDTLGNLPTFPFPDSWKESQKLEKFFVSSLYNCEISSITFPLSFFFFLIRRKSVGYVFLYEWVNNGKWLQFYA